jgi:hypothetical protein
MASNEIARRMLSAASDKLRREGAAAQDLYAAPPEPVRLALGQRHRWSTTQAHLANSRLPALPYVRRGRADVRNSSE